MNENTVEQSLPIRLQTHLSTISITSFFFYFIYFLLFVLLAFLVIAYFYPDSSFRQMYDSLLFEFYKKPMMKKKISDKISNLSNNTEKEIQVPAHQKINLDQAVNQYMELQNQTNSELGKTTYLPPKQYTNKQGWCFIGNEKGFNTCIDVGRNDYCMSGDIYPTKDICINPSLRL